MGKSEKEKKQEKVERMLKKRNQRDISSYLNESDKYMNKTEILDRQYEELSKIKKGNEGINNCRLIRNKLKKREERH